MQERRRKRLAGLVVLILAVFGLVAAQAPSQASPADWKYLLDTVNSETVLTHPSGSVSIGQVAGSGPSAIQTVAPIGTTKVSASANPLPSPNTYLWAAGAGNVVYTPAVQFVGYYPQTYLAAYQNGNLLWSVLPPDTCAGQIETILALKQGVDGNIYIVSGRQSGCTGPEFFLSGINAQNGSTLFSVSLGGSLSLGPANFFAYTGGVALLSGSTSARLRYYSYQGALQSDTSFALSTGERVSAAAATHDGRVYAVVSKNRTATGDCPWTNVADRVEAYGPNGVIRDSSQQPITFAVEPCANIYMQASPDGLAVIVQAYNLDDRLLSLDLSLQVNWYKAFDTGTIAGREFPTWLGHDIVVDNNGNIVTLSPYWMQNQQKRGVQIGVVDTTGERKSVVHTDQLEETISSFALTSAGVGLANGTLYLAAHVCGSYQCNTSHPFKLYEIPAAGLGMDYPRGRLAGHSPTPQTQRTYVAMGDSYSAGYGIQPYGSSGCHRSELGYPKLLDESPGVNLELQAFVACTGATTTHVENGKDGEPSQLSALSATTDVVTITIGGNDVGFVDFATACVQGDCYNSALYQTTVDKIQNELPGSLDHLFGEIASRIGSNTRVLVLGYPRLMPQDDGSFPNCLLLSQDERNAASQVTVDLNTAISSAVSRADSRFKFVDADANLYGVRISPFAGHELCNDDGAYFFGVSPLEAGTSYHPNRKGAEAYAELVQKYLITHP